MLEVLAKLIILVLMLVPGLKHARRSSGLGTFGVPDRVGYLVGHPDDVLDWVAPVIWGGCGAVPE